MGKCSRLFIKCLAALSGVHSSSEITISNWRRYSFRLSLPSNMVFQMVGPLAIVLALFLWGIPRWSPITLRTTPQGQMLRVLQHISPYEVDSLYRSGCGPNLNTYPNRTFLVVYFRWDFQTNLGFKWSKSCNQGPIAHKKVPDLCPGFWPTSTCWRPQSLKPRQVSLFNSRFGFLLEWIW